MSLYRFFAKALKRSDLSDPSGPLSASITIKEASDASITVYCTQVRAPPAAHAHNLPQQAYEIKKIRKFILRVFWSIIRKLAPTKISRYTVVHAQTISAVRMRRWKYRGHTPHSKQCAMATFSLYSNVATGLLTGMTKSRPRLSLRLRLGS